MSLRIENARSRRFADVVSRRFLDSHSFAREKVKELGRVFGFRVNIQSLVKPGSKYYGLYCIEKVQTRIGINTDAVSETAWRKTPQYQGG